MFTDPLLEPANPDRVRLVTAALAKLDTLAQEITRLNSSVDEVITPPQSTIYMVEVDPRTVIKSFYTLSLQLVTELRTVLTSGQANAIHLDVLNAFLESADSVSSPTPDLTHPRTLAGEPVVPSLQKNPSLNLRSLLLVLRFLDMDKIIAAAQSKSEGAVNGEMLQRTIAELVGVVRDQDERYEALYERLDLAGIKGMPLAVVVNTLAEYIVGIKGLIDPANLSTTEDLYSNILVIFVTALQLSEMLAEMKAETQEMARLDTTDVNLEVPTSTDENEES